jgi:predicted P-loop ATPase/GTPase
MIGKATLHTKKGTRPIQLREALLPTTKITVPFNATIELFDQQNRRKYVINTPGTASVKEFLDDKRNERIDLTARIFDYMVKRITSTDDTLIQSCSDPAAVTREELKDSTVYVVP